MDSPRNWGVRLWFNNWNSQEGHKPSPLNVRVVAEENREKAVKKAFRDVYPKGVILDPPRGAKEKYFMGYVSPDRYYLVAAVSVGQVRAYLRNRWKIRLTWVGCVTAKALATRKTPPVPVPF